MHRLILFPLLLWAALAGAQSTVPKTTQIVREGPRQRMRAPALAYFCGMLLQNEFGGKVAQPVKCYGPGGGGTTNDVADTTNTCSVSSLDKLGIKSVPTNTPTTQSANVVCTFQ